MQVQVTAGAPDESGTRAVMIHSRAGDGSPWTRHATGTLPGDGDPGPPGLPDLAAWPPPGAGPADVAGLYDRFAAAGYDYGPAFRGLRAAWVRGQEVFTEAALPEGVEPGSFLLHPALLDAALHGLGLGLLDMGRTLLPFAWNGAWLAGPGTSGLRAKIARTGPDTVSVLVADGTGQPVAWIESLTARPLPARQPRGPQPGSLLRVDWIPAPAGEPPGGG